jgi:hypothetical protein
MENKIVWRLVDWLSHIGPVRIKAEDAETVTEMGFPCQVINKTRGGKKVIFDSWEDAHTALVEYQQGKIDTLQAQLDRQLVVLDSITHLQKPKL